MAIFDESVIGIAPNQITFNRYTDAIIYRAERRRVTGRDLRQFDSPSPERSGISDFKTLIGRTDFVLDGEMYPRNESYYEQGRRALRRVADVQSIQNDPDSDFGYVPYVWGETDQDKQLMVKVLFADLPEDTDNGLVQPFRLFCKVKHPVIKGTILKQADTGSSAVDPVGTVGYPLLYPALLGKSYYVLGAIAVNNGDIPAYPEAIVITGPVNRPRLVNINTGDFIEVDVNLATVLDQLVIRYDNDSTAIELNGVSVYNKLTNDSDLFMIDVGPISFQLSGSSMGVGSSARVTFYDAYPLS